MAKKNNKVGDFTILEIERELKSRIQDNIGIENYADIKQLADKRERQVSYNRKSGQQKRRINEKLKKDIPEYEKKVLEFQKSKLHKFDLKRIDNEIKQLSGKDFEWTINTKFGKHKIKSSTLMKKKNIPKYIIESAKKDLKKKKKSTDDFEKLERKIKYNLESAKEGYYLEEEDYDDEMNETDPPIVVDIVWDTIILKL